MSPTAGAPIFDYVFSMAALPEPASYPIAIDAAPASDFG